MIIGSLYVKKVNVNGTNPIIIASSRIYFVNNHPIIAPLSLDRYQWRTQHFYREIGDINVQKGIVWEAMFRYDAGQSGSKGSCCIEVCTVSVYNERDRKG